MSGDVMWPYFLFLFLIMEHLGHDYKIEFINEQRFILSRVKLIVLDHKWDNLFILLNIYTYIYTYSHYFCMPMI